MLTFKQYISETLKKQTFRGPKYATGPRKLLGVVFYDEDQVANRAVKVFFNRDSHYPNRAYNIDFSIDDYFHAPNKHSNHVKWRDHEHVLRRIQKSIEDFVTTKKPNEIYINANDVKKVKLYRTFAQHIAQKHGGEIEEIPQLATGIPKIVVRFPGKKK